MHITKTAITITLTIIIPIRRRRFSFGTILAATAASL